MVRLSSVHLSVVVRRRPSSSVTDILWLSGRSQGSYRSNQQCVLNLVMQNFSDLVHGKHFQNMG